MNQKMYTDLYINDLNDACKEIPNANKLLNSSVFITGATGMIGSAIIDILLQLNKNYKSKIKIYAGCRDYEKFLIRFGKKKNLFFVKYEASEKIKSKKYFDYIIHAASNSSPELYINEPVETMTANIIGIKNLFDYAISVKSKKILYVSSSEVYGKKEKEGPFIENDYGYVDILSVRSCYPSAKRASETLCISYSKEYDIDTSIVRPGHVYGPTATTKDMRISSMFARDVNDGKEIVLKSSGSQIRSYCYCIDCATAILTVLINGKNCEAYNISNKNSIVSIAEMAKNFADVKKQKLIFENPNNNEQKAFNPMDNSSLCSDKLEKLGWNALTNMKKGAEHTLKIIKEK